jgi:hypothetical protein
MNNVTGKEDDELLKKTAFRDQLYDNEDDELLKTQGPNCAIMERGRVNGENLLLGKKVSPNYLWNSSQPMWPTPEDVEKPKNN